MIEKTWTISKEEGRRMAQEMRAKAQAERTAVEALAEAQSEVHGTLDLYHAATHRERAGARVWASEMLDALHARGYRLVPEVPTEEMKQAGARYCYQAYDGDQDAALSDAEACYLDMCAAAPGAKEEGK